MTTTLKPRLDAAEGERLDAIARTYMESLTKTPLDPRDRAIMLAYIREIDGDDWTNEGDTFACGLYLGARGRERRKLEVERLRADTAERSARADAAQQASRIAKLDAAIARAANQLSLDELLQCEQGALHADPIQNRSEYLARLDAAVTARTARKAKP